MGKQEAIFRRRSASFFAVVGLHAALFYTLYVSLGSTITKSVIPPLLGHTIDVPRPPEKPPVLPTESLIRGIVIDVPIPPPVEPVDAVPGDVIRGNPADPLPPEPQPEAPHLVSRMQGAPGIGFPNPDDYYPADAIRRGEHGNVIVQVCVDTRGRLTANPQAVQSSGSPRLDAGALALARAGSGHYRASTEDARPVDSCFPFSVTFRLRN